MTDDELTRIADRFGTPIFVYNGSVIVERCAQLADILRPIGSLLYSIKANPCPSLCQLVRDQGLGAEVASGGEFEIALKAGFSPYQIFASGPAKSDQELAAYIDHRITAINVESRLELLRVEKLAAARGARADVALRINPALKMKGARIKMGGDASQFGIEEADLYEVIVEARRHSSVRIVGLHVYWGTQILEAGDILAGFEHILDVAIQIKHRFDLRLRLLNLGGGFGIPFVSGEAPLDLDALRAGVAALKRRIEEEPALSGVDFFFETGRFIVGPAGTLLSKVMDVKTSRDRTFVVLDAGINAFFSVSPLFRFDRRPGCLRTLNRHPRTANPTQKLDLVGPLCTKLDCLAKGISMPRPDPGDLVVFENSGAYGMTMSLPLFLSRGIPAEILSLPSGGLVHTSWSLSSVSVTRDR